MDVVKVFTEEPIGLEALVPDTEPDARQRDAPGMSLEAFLSRPPEPYARAYIAGTFLGPPRRVGATALGDVDAWVRPLLDWAAARPWSVLEDGMVRSVLEDEASVVLASGSGHALAIGALEGADLVNAVSGEPEVGASQRRDRLPALRRVLEGGASVLFREPAFDGWDWSLFSTAPLRDDLVEAFRRHPSEARRIVAPFQRARGEHTFYLEQWTLDDLPEWAEEL
ncbi:hypothetical protein [Rubrivirga sp.]|uniref:hypothetical protein n=1 Tax=Rubrivirga sp. TaxID=1885344 RepID=UPI003C780667